MGQVQLWSNQHTVTGISDDGLLSKLYQCEEDKVSKIQPDQASQVIFLL